MADYSLNLKANVDTSSILKQFHAIERTGLRIKIDQSSFDGLLATTKTTTKNLKSVNKELDSIKGSMIRIPKSVSTTNTELTKTNKTLKQTSQSFSDILVKMSKFYAVSEVIGLVTTSFRSWYEAVSDLDKALTEFKKVSDFKGAELDKYVQSLSEMGELAGRTTAEMVEAAGNFKKSGFSESDAAILAQTASVFQNIADSELSAADAALVIISNLKAFNFNAQDSIRVIDAINEVSNKYSVSSTDLSLGLSKTAAAMGTLGNSFEQTVALMTGAGEILPNQSGKIARGLRTVGLNISSLANKSSELALGYNNMTVALRDSEGQMRSTYDILGDIAKYWGQMSEAQKQSLGLTIAGKNQYEVLASELQNFSQTQKAYETALHSSGSALKENAAYAESLEYKLQMLKKQWQDLANSVASSNFLKMIIDTGTALLKFANTDIGTSLIQIALLSTALTGLSKGFRAMSKAVKGSAIFRLLTFNFNGLIVGTERLSWAIGVLFEVLKRNPIMLVVTAGMALYKVFNYIAGSADRAREKTQGFKDELDEINSKIQDLESQKSSAGTTAEIANLDKQIERQKELARLQQEDINQSLKQQYIAEGWTETPTVKYTDESGVEQTIEGYSKATKMIEDYKKAVKDGSDKQNELKQQLIETATKFEEYEKAGIELTDAQKQLIAYADKVSGVTETIKNRTTALSLVTQQFASSLKVEGDAYVFVTEAAKEAARVQKQNEYNKTETTLKQVQARIAAYQSEANAQLALSEAGGIEAYGYSKRDLARLRNQIAQQKAQGVDTSQLEKKYADYQTYYSTKDALQLIQNQIDTINAMGVSTGGTGDSISTGIGGGSSVKTAQERAEESLKAQHEAYQKIISDMEYQLYIAEKNGASDEERIQMMQKIQEMLLSQRAVYEKQGLASNHEYIQELNKQWWSYADDIKDIQDKITENVKKAQEEQLENLKNSLDAQLELLRYLKDERVSAIDEQIAQLEKEKDTLKERNDEIADGIELQRLEDALQAAKQKKVRIWKSGIGWTYEQDVEAVRQAQEELDEYKRNQQQEAEEKRIDEEIAKLEDYKQQWEDVVYNYEKQQNILLNEQTIGKNKEYQNIQDRIKNLEDFKDEYARIINEINNLQIRQNYMGAGAGAGLSSGGGGASSSSTDNRSNQKKYLDNLVSSGTVGQKKWAQSQIAQGKYATGSLSVPQSGLSLVGEQGRELRVLNQGDGIIPNKLTENLMNLGRYSIPQLASIMNTVNQKDSSNNMNIQNLTVALPNIRDNSSVETIQRALLDLPNKLKQKAYSI